MNGASLVQPLHGIYQSATDAGARLTIIGASGQPNHTDQLRFSNAATGPAGFTAAVTDLFPATSSASDRSWSNRQIPLGSVMPGFLPPSTADQNYGFGETLVATLDHTSRTPYHCISLGAIVMSTAIKDGDSDGAADGIEDGVATAGADLDAGHEGRGRHRTSEPVGDGRELASQRHLLPDGRDAGDSVEHVWRPGERSVSGCADRVGEHRPAQPHAESGCREDHHRTYLHSPLQNADTSFPNGIWPHLDVGDPAGYVSYINANRAAGDPPDYGLYFVGTGHKGGQLANEARCGVDADPVGDPGPNNCPFYYFPGTVGWMRGFLQYEELETGGVSFDPARAGIFHHAFYVHARGVRKSTFPCLDANGNETLYADATAKTCAAGGANPLFRVPKTISGVAQLPGQRLMISTGLWDTVNGVGSPELVAATTLHEAGHNGNLWHGGPPPTWNATTRQLTFEPNCKPNYPSIMSYLFQVVGQLDDTGKQFFDYSRDANPGDHALNENALTSNFFPLLQPYRTAWFAPVVPGSLP